MAQIITDVLPRTESGLHISRSFWRFIARKLFDSFYSSNFYNIGIYEIMVSSHFVSPPINFLDVTITKDKEGNLITDLYTKPTDSHLYLHYSSFHPRHQEESLPYSQALRLRRICSTDSLYKTTSQNMLQNFIHRGYPIQLVRSAIEKALSKNQDELLQPKDSATSQKTILPFITTNNPFNPPIRRILSKYRQILETSEDL